MSLVPIGANISNEITIEGIYFNKYHKKIQFKKSNIHDHFQMTAGYYVTFYLTSDEPSSIYIQITPNKLFENGSTSIISTMKTKNNPNTKNCCVHNSLLFDKFKFQEKNPRVTKSGKPGGSGHSIPGTVVIIDEIKYIKVDATDFLI